MSWIARAVTSDGRQDHRLGVGGHLVLVVVPERDLDPFGLRFDLVDLADRHAEDAHFVADEDAVAVGEVGDDVGAADRRRCTATSDVPGDQQRATSTVARPIFDCATSWLTSRGGAAPPVGQVRHLAGCGFIGTGVGVGAPVRDAGAGGPGRRAAGRRRPAAARGRGSSRAGNGSPGTARVIARVAGDGVGQGQPRLPALAGARVGHRQRRGSRAGRSAGRLRCDGSSTLGSSPRSENAASTNGCMNWPGQQVGDIGLEERPRATDSPSDIA